MTCVNLTMVALGFAIVSRIMGYVWTGLTGFANTTIVSAVWAFTYRARLFTTTLAAPVGHVQIILVEDSIRNRRDRQGRQ